jgi:hypothetical protein
VPYLACNRLRHWQDAVQYRANVAYRALWADVAGQVRQLGQ